MLAQNTIDKIKRIKQKTNGILPILVGFGISQPDHAKTIIDAGADGVIIGLAIVNIIKANINNFSKVETEMVEFVSSIKNRLLH